MNDILKYKNPVLTSYGNIQNHEDIMKNKFDEIAQKSLENEQIINMNYLNELIQNTDNILNHDSKLSNVIVVIINQIVSLHKDIFIFKQSERNQSKEDNPLLDESIDNLQSKITEIKRRDGHHQLEGIDLVDKAEINDEDEIHTNLSFHEDTKSDFRKNSDITIDTLKITNDMLDIDDNIKNNKFDLKIDKNEIQNDFNNEFMYNKSKSKNMKTKSISKKTNNKPKNDHAKRETVLLDQIAASKLDGINFSESKSFYNPKVIKTCIKFNHEIKNTDEITTLSWNKKSNCISQGFKDGTIIIENVFQKDNQLLNQIEYSQTLKDHSDSIQAITQSNSTDLMASASSDGTIQIFAPECAYWMYPNEAQQKQIKFQTLIEHSDGFQAVDFSPNDIFIAVSTWKGIVKVQKVNYYDHGGDIRTIKEIVQVLSVSENADPVISLKQNQDGSFLGFGTWDGQIIVQRLNQGKYDSNVLETADLLYQDKLKNQPFVSIHWNNNDMVSSCRDGSLCQFTVVYPNDKSFGKDSLDSKDSKSIIIKPVFNTVLAYCENDTPGFIVSQDFAPGLKKFSTGSIDGMVKVQQVWQDENKGYISNFKKIALIQVIRDHKDQSLVKWNFYNSVLATAGKDGNLQLYEQKYDNL